MLVRIVRAVSKTNRPRLIQIFLRAIRLRFTRSRCVALSWLAALAAVHLRPASSSHFVNQSLAPVLELLAAEDEEDIHKALALALARLFPVFSRYYDVSRLTALVDCLVLKLLGGSDARSRHVAAALCSICADPASARSADCASAQHTQGGGACAEGRGREILANHAVSCLLRLAERADNACPEDGRMGQSEEGNADDERVLGCLVGLGRLVKAGLPTATMERFAAALTRPALAACRAVSLERCQDSRVCSAALLLLDAVFSRVPESGWWEGAAHTGVDVGECVAVLGALLGEQGVGLGRAVRQSHVVGALQTLQRLFSSAPLSRLLATNELALLAQASLADSNDMTEGGGLVDGRGGNNRGGHAEGTVMHRIHSLTSHGDPSLEGAAVGALGKLGMIVHGPCTEVKSHKVTHADMMTCGEVPARRLTWLCVCISWVCMTGNQRQVCQCTLQAAWWHLGAWTREFYLRAACHRTA